MKPIFSLCGRHAARRVCCSVIPFVLFSLVSVRTAPGAQAGSSADETVIAAIKTELQQRTAKTQFAGAVLIAKDGKPVFQAAYGEADREKKIPNTVETKFRFGSMGKMFTATAILQLVQAGKIKLDNPITKYLPDYPNRQVGAVTIYQLLTHTGGTGDIFSPEFVAHRLDLKEHSDYVALYGNRGVEFAPGSDWQYSNYGFILLGRIIEVVSGETYYDYVRDHVFRAAGMDSTGNLPEDQNVPTLAISYTRGGGLRLIGPGPGPRNNGADHHPAGPDPDAKQSPLSGPARPATGLLPYRGTSAGGGYSTVGDFLRFANALASHKLLNTQNTELLSAGKVQTKRPGTKYAFGFEDQLSPDGVRRVGHGGGAPGMNGRLSIYPASGYTVVVLANLDPPAADEIARFIEERLQVH